jgi:phosphoglycerate dehydrogenase-like enzyme/glyoxylase-like metal-dependent hydrolase (beta-lactamase superfamily II)
MTMRHSIRIGLILAAALLCGHAAFADAELPKMQFEEVREVAPGVFFRYSSIGPEGSNIPFGGCNNIWIVFEDYVVVVDANFPKEAGDVIAAIKKTTSKPIRYVLDTHHHGDHSYGNIVFGNDGASIVAQTNCARILRLSGPEEFRQAGIGPMGRKDIAQSSLKIPSIVFDDKLVLDDGKQRVEFLYFGHAHTAGDALAYLPRLRILCTGDACVNGAYNFMGHSDSGSWVRVLDRAGQLEVDRVLPGHGPVARKELLETQKRYFVELRRQVRAGIQAGKAPEEVRANLDMPWYKQWTGVVPSLENVRHVYDELTGRIAPLDLIEDLGVYAGPSPTSNTPGWTKPRKIVVPNLMPARLAELKRVAPDVEFVPAHTEEEAAKAAVDADAVLELCSPEIVRAGKSLRWIHIGHAGVEKYLSPELVGSPIVLTNTQRLHGPNCAEHAFALLLALTRAIRATATAESTQGRAGPEPAARLRDLYQKTMLVIGLGGLGTEVSRRAHAFGMKVMALDAKEMDCPGFVFRLMKPGELMSALPQADVVVVACPLTDATRGLLGKKQFAAMKKSAYVINIARGGIIQTQDLTEALQQKQLAGAGLDVTDPEPLPAEHPLRTMSNVVITPHMGGSSAGATARMWRLLRENVRRFAAGEPLLCVVDKAKGY